MDLHIDTLWQMTKWGEFDINEGASYSQVSAEGVKKAGLKSAVFALYVPKSMEFDCWHYLQEQLSFAWKQRVEGFKIHLALEGGALIQNELGVLEWFAKKADIKYLTLVHNSNIGWACSATDEGEDTGLSNFGRAVVWACNKLDVLVDVSHASYRTAMDALAASKGVVIASHSGCWSVKQHARNLKDKVIRGIAASGGVVGIPFAKRFVGSIEELGEHIDHVVQLVGIDYVAIGSDIDGTFMIDGFWGIGNWQNVILEALDKRGYNSEALQKVLSTNAERVIGQ